MSFVNGCGRFVPAALILFRGRGQALFWGSRISIDPLKIFLNYINVITFHTFTAFLVGTIRITTHDFIIKLITILRDYSICFFCMGSAHASS